MKGEETEGSAFGFGNAMWAGAILIGILAMDGCLPSKTTPILKPRIAVNDLHTSVLDDEVYRDTLRRVDGKSGILELKLVQGPQGSSLSDSIVTWPVDQIGDFEFGVSALDNETGLQSVYTWMVHARYPNLPPEIRSDPRSLLSFGVVGARYEDTLNVFDFNNDIPILRNPEGFPWLTIRDSIFLIQPGPADTGTHTVSIIVEDGKGGADTIAWSLRISTEDREICGFSNLKVGTSWVYLLDYGRTITSLPFQLDDSIRIDGVSAIGDTAIYSIRERLKSESSSELYDRSFVMSVAGGVIRAWTDTNSYLPNPWAFGSDCFKDSKIAYGNVFGVRTPIFIGSGTKGYFNEVRIMEIRVQGVGLVALTEMVPNPKQSIRKETVLVRFNERNVRIRSWEPFELVYE